MFNSTMRIAFFTWAIAAFASMTAVAQAVPEGIAPEGGPPEGCRTSVDGEFTIGIGVMGRRGRRETATEVCLICFFGVGNG